MKKAVIAAAALLAPCAICYYAGVFITAFDTNMCYSSALSKLSERAQDVAASGDRASMESYAAMLKGLPLGGYESDCERILSAVEAGTAGPRSPRP